MVGVVSKCPNIIKERKSSKPLTKETEKEVLQIRNVGPKMEKHQKSSLLARSVVSPRPGT